MQDSNQPMGEGTNGGGTEEGGQTASKMASDVKQQLKDKAHEVASQAQSAAEGGKARLVERAQGVAEALHQASDRMRADDQQEVARYTQGVADKIEQLSGYLRQRDLAAMAEDVKRLAQRQPALFLGGAFTAGLISARFLKSSASRAKAGAASNAGANTANRGGE